MLLRFSVALAALPACVVAFPINGTRAQKLTESTDSELVSSALTGDRAAHHALYVRHVAHVTQRVARLLGRSAEAEDVVQDTFVVAFRDLAQLSEPARFGGWLSVIGVHQVHRRLRRRALLRRIGLDSQTDDVSLSCIVDPAAGPFVRTMLKQLDEALVRLPIELRLAWMLRHVEGCALPEVAEQCRVSLATVKRHLVRADKELRHYIDFEGNAEESDVDQIHMVSDRGKQ